MPKSKHSAAGSNAGYSFQFYRALYWLSKATPGELVGIETDDDIVVGKKDDILVFEQDKHSIANRNINPIGDTSKALWNTLGIWLDLVSSTDVSLEKCRFLIVTNKHVPKKCLIKKISSARSTEDYSTCLSKLRRISGLPKKVKPLANKVLQYNDSLIERLLRRVKLIDQNSNQHDGGLVSEIIGNLRIPSSISDKSEEIFHEMLGWLQQTAMQAWYQKKPAIIKAQAFINALDGAKRSRKRDKILERSAHLIEVSQDQVGQHRGNVFVKQMRLISEDENEIDGAIDDFIRASSELLRLSDEGELTPSDIEALRYNLADRWGTIFRRNIRFHQGKHEKDIGYHVFDETTNDYLVNIKGIPTEHHYFTRGTYHRLSQNLEVGWHPRFKELLK